MRESTDKKYYKIKEVSEMLGLPASTLRFWESQFSLLKPRRNDGGTRFYTPSDIETLRMIKYLIKDKGLKIEAARDVIKHNHSGISRQQRAVEKLKDIRNRLQSLLDALNRMR
ncbi:MAG: MerR family transcriptional regulator [Muribaculaceae bacterium]|nr:MerR family transcriptional regulator [Muribaculaceae bacterium]MDE6703555.1 MerR family transcriptional regulator [Muribaculaceae bacterium]